MPTIQELITQISKNEILLPEFQRGYVWKEHKVRGLMQSLYRGYPTGHLLIWKTYKPALTRGTSPSADGHSLLLLDGQQRLTSLYVLFEGKAPPFYEGESLFFNLYFNVQTEEFRFWQKSLMDGNPAWIGVHEFLAEGLNAFLDRLDQMSEDEQALVQSNLKRFNRLDSIRNYRYTVDQLSSESLTVEEVVEIFNRVNSEGTELTKADLAIAHICSVWPEARQDMRVFAALMEKHGFGVELDFLVRCVAGVASDSVLLEGTFYKVDVLSLQDAWKKVRGAFEHLINVLRHDAYIDKLGRLPTPNVLIPMTVYLAKNDGVFPTEAIKEKFVRWMFLAGLWGRYSASTPTRLQRDVSLLTGLDPTSELVNEILKERGRIAIEASDLDGKGAGSPPYKFSYVVARAREARDWFTGIRLYDKAVGASNGLESHHIFPRKVLLDSGLDATADKKIINELANRAFLTQKANRTISSKRPVEYLADVEDDRPGQLKAQCVPMDRSLWMEDQYPAFLVARRHQLAEAMNEFLDNLVSKETAQSEHDRELAEALKRGESAGLEFKSSLRWDINEQRVNKVLEGVIAKTVAGFMNTADSGTLLIGVDDNGTVLGLADDYKTLKKQDRDGFELQLTQVVLKYLGESAAVFMTTTFHEIDGKDVCQVVAEPSDHPIYYQDGQTTSLYVRMGNQTRALPVDQAVKYTSSRWGVGKV